MTDRVHADVHAPQADIRDPAVDAAAVDAGGEELRASDAAVLARRDPREDVESFTDTEDEATSSADSPPGPSFAKAGGAAHGRWGDRGQEPREVSASSWCA